jgi:hypothetical protein
VDLGKLLVQCSAQRNLTATSAALRRILKPGGTAKHASIATVVDGPEGADPFFKSLYAMTTTGASAPEPEVAANAAALLTFIKMNDDARLIGSDSAKESLSWYRVGRLLARWRRSALHPRFAFDTPLPFSPYRDSLRLDHNDSDRSSQPRRNGGRSTVRSFLSKLFGTGTPRRDDPLVELFEDHAGTALERQLRALPTNSSGPWNMDFATVPFKLTLTDGHDSIQVGARLIGQEGPEWWMWGWAAPSTPPELISQVARIRRVGEDRRIAELTEPRVRRTRLPGHVAAMITVGLLGGAGYYAIPFDEGKTVFVLAALPADRESAHEAAARAAERLLKAKKDEATT